MDIETRVHFKLLVIILKEMLLFECFLFSNTAHYWLKMNEDFNSIRLRIRCHSSTQLFIEVIISGQTYKTTVRFPLEGHHRIYYIIGKDTKHCH